MDLRLRDKRLQTSAVDKYVLERMQYIIKANSLSYDKAKTLASDYKVGKIPAGYIGHKYLNPAPGYRIISAYSKGNGFIHTYYATAEDAWNDPRIQSNIAAVGIQYADYDTYFHTVKCGRPWTIMGLTILQCKISTHGNIRIIKNEAFISP